MRRYTESERQRIVRSFESSGLTAAAFCRRQGVSTASLAQWRKRRSQQATTSAPGTPRPQSWLPVVLSDTGDPPSRREGSCYVMVCGECRLEAPPGFALHEVRQLWELLAGGRPEHTLSAGREL